MTCLGQQGQGELNSSLEKKTLKVIEIFLPLVAFCRLCRWNQGFSKASEFWNSAKI